MARAKRPAPITPALIDVRVILVAAVVASPAAYRAAQGLLTLDQALTRFGLVLLACAAVTGVLRALWPVLAGEPVAAEGEPEPELSPPPE
ncbi:hypothetical protein [Nocardioides sp. LML1-1-1.1]|uniref:hypothetical protein n=1 Tax=Nocardioides sp. LML1-1-1.1 TaxID=3135248 RepID=UPI00341DAC06